MKRVIPPKEDPTAFGATIGAYVACTGTFVDANQGSITALATFVIAIFTGTLWVTTKRQIHLTQVALRGDRPFLLVQKGVLASQGITIKREREDVEPWVTISPSIVTFINYGKGPAMIRKVVASFEPAKLPHRRNYLTFLHQSHDLKECREVIWDQDIIAFEKPMSVTTYGASDLFKSDEEFEATQFVIYGRVDYTDVFENCYSTEFCLVMRIREVGYRSDEDIDVESVCVVGPKAHNRHT
jgi:hypothetical protein